MYMMILLAVLSILLVFLARLLYKNSKMIKKIDRQNTLLNTVNQVSSVLLEPEPLTDLSSEKENFELIIKISMGFMAKAVGVERICIWIKTGDKNRQDFFLGFQWEKGNFMSYVKKGNLAPNIILEEHPDWNDTLTQGNCINSLVSEMAASEQEVLKPRNIISVFVVPVFFHDLIWGFVGFDHCTADRRFKESETLILRSVSRMLAHSVIRNEMTEQLETAKVQAEQSNRSKSIFLSHMSHEIRTPMNAIMGIAEIQLQNEELSPDTSEALGKIYESGDLLLSIINDILDLSKIESGKLEIIPVKYDLPSLINDTTQLNRMRYESKPIEFVLQLDDNIPIELCGDELRIKQILNNILSNAFKYTDKGRIEFSVSFEPLESDEVILIFEVSDTGQGMTEEQIGRLYEEYTRFNLETNRTKVGAGLGMSITKRLVDLMNGEISVKSEPDKGSVFTVRLKQKKTSNEVCGKTLADKLKSFSFHNSSILKRMQFLREYMPYGSVLVVDDVESNIYVAKGMLLPYGLNIESASSGFEAIDYIKSGKTYDIIFMDHMMPKMDGIETVKIIRSMGYTNPIIALTANALVGRAKMFLQNGFDSFCPKPIDSRELDMILNEFIRNRKPQEVIEAARCIPVKNKIKLYGIENFFVRDAENTVNILENIDIEKLSVLKDDTSDPSDNKTRDPQLASFITTVHGIKSALSNIGEKELSNLAFKLEKAGETGNINFMENETPGFINALKSLIIKYKPAEDKNESGEQVIPKEEMDFLYIKLNEIKEACTVYDKKAAKDALNDIRKKMWPGNVNQILNDITIHLLHSEFPETEQVIEDFKKQNSI